MNAAQCRLLGKREATREEELLKFVLVYTDSLYLGIVLCSQAQIATLKTIKQRKHSKPVANAFVHITPLSPVTLSHHCFSGLMTE